MHGRTTLNSFFFYNEVEWVNVFFFFFFCIKVEWVNVLCLMSKVPFRPFSTMIRTNAPSNDHAWTISGQQCE